MTKGQGRAEREWVKGMGMVMTRVRVGGTSDGRNVGRFVRCGAPRFVSVVPTQAALAMDWRQIKNNTEK